MSVMLMTRSGVAGSRSDHLRRYGNPINGFGQSDSAAVGALGANGIRIPWNGFKACRMSPKEIKRSTQPEPGTAGPCKSDLGLMGALGSPENARVNDATSCRSALGANGSGGAQGSVTQFRTTSPHCDIVTSSGPE